MKKFLFRCILHTAISDARFVLQDLRGGEESD